MKPANLSSRGVATAARRRGYALIAFTLAAVFLVGSVGLAVDIGRMYIAHAEAQAFVDSMALTAALKLNGDKSGVDAADLAVANQINSKAWDLATRPFEVNVTGIKYASSGLPGEWYESGAAPVGTPTAFGPPQPVTADRVRVDTSIDLPLYFLPILVHSATSTVRTSAVAVRSTVNAFPANSGVAPFSPMSHKHTGAAIHDPKDPFGFQVGRQYTLRWNKTKDFACEGDDYADVLAAVNHNGMNDWLHAVCQGASDCKSALNGNGLDAAMSLGPIETKEGNATSIVKASDDRVARDGDPTATSYFRTGGYLANQLGTGERVVFVPVNDGVVAGSGSNSRANAVGFAAFLLMDSESPDTKKGKEKDSDHESKAHICGEYLGAAIPGFPYSGGLPPGSNPPAHHPSLAVRLAK